VPRRIAMVNIRPLLEYYGRELKDLSFEIHSETTTFPVEVYYEMMKRGRVVYDEDVQRYYVWDAVRKSMWIESLILHFPVPPIFLVEKAGQYVIVDGLQRSLTIRDYLDNKFWITYSSIPKLIGKKFSDLPPDIKERLLNFRIPAVIIKTPKIDLIMIEVFRRLNLGAKKLTARQLLFVTVRTICIQYIKEVAKSPEFKQLIMPKEGEVKSMYDLWLVLGMFSSLRANKPLNTTSSGVNVKEVADYVFNTALLDEERICNNLKMRTYEILDHMSKLGFERRDFSPATYLGRGRDYVMSPLLNFIALAVLKYYPIINADMIRSFVKKHIEQFTELTRSSNQGLLDDLSKLFSIYVESKKPV